MFFRSLWQAPEFQVWYGRRPTQRGFSETYRQDDGFQSRADIYITFHFIVNILFTSEFILNYESIPGSTLLLCTREYMFML